MIQLTRSAWRMVVVLLMISGASICALGIVIYMLVGSVEDNHNLVMANGQVIKQLQDHDARAQHQLSALTQYTQALQRQLIAQKVQPLPAPPAVQKILVVNGSSGSQPSTATPRPSAGPSPKPRPSSPAPRPTPKPTPSPTPSPTPACRVPVGTICVIK